MNNSQSYPELDSLIALLMEDRLDESHFQRLKELLAESDQACLRYIEAMHLKVELSEWAQEHDGALRVFVEECVTNRDKTIAAIYSAGVTDCGSMPLKMGDTGFDSAGQPIIPPISMRHWTGPILVIGFLTCLVLLVSWIASAPNKIAEIPDSSTYSHSTPTDGKGTYRSTVGRVIQVSPHAIWREGSSPDDFLLRLMEGDRLELLSGLAEVELHSGVRLIIHEQTSFVFSTSNRGLLEKGSVTGLAEDGNYTILTATAEVIDLGTEFGVTVNEDSATEVFVFEGEVQVVGRGQSELSNIVQLMEGNAAHVDSAGHLAPQSENSSSQFVRALPEQPMESARPTSVSLVDVLSGGDGLGRRLSVALDPLTCDIDQRPWTTADGPGETESDAKYHSSDYHPMIDGTFIIPSNGKGVVLNSAKDVWNDFGKNDGSSWGPIWARRRTKDFLLHPTRDFWGTGTLPFILDRLASAKDGAIGLHPNVGITIDLEEVRSMHRVLLDSFQATLTNLDTAPILFPKKILKKHPIRTFDFWVFVDGELRFSKKNFARNVEGILLEVPLKPGDRFLTLVSTDSGNLNSFDHLVLIDPVLEFHEQ